MAVKHEDLEMQSLVKSKQIKLPPSLKRRLGILIEKYGLPMFPWACFAFLCLCTYSFLSFVIPHSIQENGEWTVDTAYMTLFLAFFPFAMLVCFLRSLILPAGPVPKAWKEWEGSHHDSPEIPKYAELSKTWIEQKEILQNKQSDSMMKKLLGQMEGFKAPKTIYYHNNVDGNNSEPQIVVPGVTVVSNDGPSPYDHLKFHSFEIEKAQTVHADSAEGEGVTVSDGSLMKLSDKLQWGINISEEDQQAALKSLQGLSISTIMDPLSSAPKKDSAICSKDKCSNYRPPRTHHCSSCRDCVERLDHHCIWLNKCVGLGNQKSFFLFLFYFMICIVLYVSLSLRVFYTVSDLNPLNIFIFVIAFPFGYFIAALLFAQVSNLMYNITELERLFTPPEALYKYSSPSKLKNFSYVLGDSMVNWLNPFY